MLVRRERFTGSRRCVVDEFVALALGRAVRLRRRFTRWGTWLIPGLAAIVRPLNDLPKPAAGLRGIQSMGINRGTLEMVQLPPGKMRSTDFPLPALPVRCQDERAFL